MRTVLITGVTGMMGSLMADLLCYTDHYESVPGKPKRREIFNVIGVGHNADLTPVKGLLKLNHFKFEYMNVARPLYIHRVFKTYKPDFVFNFAAMSDMQSCADNQEKARQVNVEGPNFLLQAIEKYCPEAVFLNMGSTREFSTNRFYGTTKRMAREIVDGFRQKGLKCAQPYLSLNDCEKRIDPKFVSAKIIQGLRDIQTCGFSPAMPPLELGNIDQVKYWGVTHDFIRGLWNMAEGMSLCSTQKELDYYTNVAFFGENHTVREFLETAMELMNIEYVHKDSTYFRVDERLMQDIELVKYDSTKYATDTDLTIPKSDFTHLYDYNRTPFKHMVGRMIKQ